MESYNQSRTPHDISQTDGKHFTKDVPCSLKKIVAVVDLSFVFNNVTMSVVSEKNLSDKK